MKKETLVSIAERSGCSISTVSRVLSGNAAKYRISQRTVARVTEEVKRCNYTPSLLAKGLRTNRTDTIGLLIPNIENSFFAGVAGVVIRESRNYNYKVKAVHESGLRIPDDISVVSFDDNMLFNYLDPAITCIGQPTDEIGTLAVKLLIRAVREPGAAPSHLHLPPSLIIRRSVRNLLL